MTEFLTTKEVADLLRLKERKVYELVKTDAIPVSRVTGKLLFPRDLIETWVLRNTEYAGGVESLAQRPLVLAGSHDPLVDWALRESGAGIATYFDGSLDGLKRLVSGDAIAAGMHIREDGTDEDGGWNRKHIMDALPGQPLVLIEWAKRRQGLLLAPESDGKISSLKDLRGKRIIPRQETAGSRVLLAHLIAEAGLTEADFELVDPPARNETDVATAIADGKADAGLAIETVARRMRLPFLPLAEERYDLAIWRRDYFEEPMQKLVSFTHTDAFAAKAAELGGYDISGSGTVHYNGP